MTETENRIDEIGQSIYSAVLFFALIVFSIIMAYSLYRFITGDAMFYITLFSSLVGLVGVGLIDAARS